MGIRQSTPLTPASKHLLRLLDEIEGRFDFIANNDTYYVTELEMVGKYIEELVNRSSKFFEANRMSMKTDIETVWEKLEVIRQKLKDLQVIIDRAKSKPFDT